MRSKTTRFTAVIVAMLLVAIPLSYLLWNDRQQRNDQVRDAGVYYRSALMSAAELEKAVAAHNVRTVMNEHESN